MVVVTTCGWMPEAQNPLAAAVAIYLKVPRGHAHAQAGQVIVIVFFGAPLPYEL